MGRSHCSVTTSTAPFARAARAARSRRAARRRTRSSRSRRDGQPEDVDDCRRGCPPRVRRGPVAAPRGRPTARGVLRRIAGLIRERADDFIRVEVLDTGVPIAQARGLAARAAQNFEYYAGVITELHGRSFQVARRVPQLHDPQAGRRGRADHALERAADALDVAPRAGARRRQHGRAEARRVGAASRRRCSPRCSTPPACPKGVFNVVHGFGETAGAPLSAHPGVNLICFTGETVDGQPRDRRGRADAQALVGRARRQVAGRRVRGRRSRARGRRRAGADLHDERPALHRRLAAARAALALRPDRRRPSPRAPATSASATRPIRARSSAR